MTNGQKLRKMRLEAAWTQQKLSDAVHVNKRTVQRWEAGDRKCPDAIVMLLEMLVSKASVKEL